MRQTAPKADHIDRIWLFVTPLFPSLALTQISNVFRLANRESGHSVFEWQLISLNGGAVDASDGTSVQTAPLPEQDFTGDSVFVFAAYRPLDPVDARFVRWLRRRQQRGAFLAAVESGCHLLAEAGVFGEHAVAMHYEDVGTFREQWPLQPVFDGIYHLQDRVASAAGASAALDFALAFVERQRGTMLAEQIAHILLHERRDMYGRHATAVSSPGAGQRLLQQCRQLMLDHLEEPLSIPELCRQLDIHERRLRRLFDRALKVSPIQYYVALRLTEARFMLVSTDLRVAQVGLACGFENAAAFSRAFKAHFGFAPSQRRSPYTGLLPTPFWPQASS